MKNQAPIKTRLTILFFYSLTVFTSTHSIYASENKAIIAKENIRDNIIGLNGFSWHYGFDIELQKKFVLVSVAVNLIPASGVSRVELSQVKPIWKKGIEQIWSDKYAIQTKNGDIYPIQIKVGFRGPKFHHAVIVRPGKSHSDELNWNLRDTEQIVAHEFGHMLGAYDEYKRGANDPDNPVIDKTSIMTSNPKLGQSYGRHFQMIKSWFANKTQDKDVRVILIEQD